jgi:hypothetical protein
MLLPYDLNGMAGIADPNTVDVVAQSPDGTYLVVMIEDRPWGTDPDQPNQLRKKINAYAGYILDGSLAQVDPAIAGKRIDIQLDCVNEPAEDIVGILERARDELQKLDIGFRLNVRS